MKIKKCSKCGSEDVVVDAYVKWNPEKDDWEIDNVFDYCFCNECEQECDLIDEEVIEDAQERVNKLRDEWEDRSC